MLLMWVVWVCALAMGGIKEEFSYGGRLSSLVGWRLNGGNLTWRKQEYFVEHVLGVPISQGSLAKMHRWFSEFCGQQEKLIKTITPVS